MSPLLHENRPNVRGLQVFLTATEFYLNLAWVAAYAAMTNEGEEFLPINM